MSENKRVQLIPLTSQKDSDKALKKEHTKTIRIQVVLPESTEDTCPEYNYKDELVAAKKRFKSKEDKALLNGLNEFGDDDDDVKRIAREMEAKYGTGSSSNKKKRKLRKDDYADIGMGYDESDSFIDNTDGYDEMIPQNVTTLHGGFYINSGALEFKTDDEACSDFSASSSEDENTKINRKRIIESSDETDRENKTEPAKAQNLTTPIKKKRKLQNGVQPSLKKKLLAQNKIYMKKRRLNDSDFKTVKDLLKEKRCDLNMSVTDNEEIHNIEEKSDALTVTTATSKNVCDVIESVVKAANVKKEEAVKSCKDVSSHEKPIAVVKSEVKLPENLSPDILCVINSIKKIAEQCSSTLDGKSSFPPDLNLLILRLERKSKCLGKPSKMKVFEHLANALKCKATVLIRRAQSLVLEDEQKRLKTLLANFQTEVNKIMPGLLENYEKESQCIIQKKFAQEGGEIEDVKSLRMPKRRFQWNDITKKHLKDIILLKKRCLLLEGKTKEVIDNLMTTFLKTEVQIIWPDGWMSMNALNKIYTTYADTKRLINNGTKVTSLPVTPSTNVKTLPSNLSIIPVKSDETSINLSVKSLPVESLQDSEVKLKVKPPSELFKTQVNKRVEDNVIILDSVPSTIGDRFSPPKTDDSYCQVIDLSDSKRDSPKISEVKTKHNESKSDTTKVKTASDDIQKVMENLKNLQKMSSSPKKNHEVATAASPISSPVSVIAVNKNFAPKTVAAERLEKNEYTGSFQDEFQKQLLSFTQYTTNSNKNYNRYPHISASGTSGMISGDKYYQNSNNNYAQSLNCHKSSTSNQQAATAPKPPQK